MATQASPLLGLAVLLAFGVVALVIAGALLPRRRIQQSVVVNVASASPTHWEVLVSPDGRYWWDGARWLDASSVAPAGAVLSPDGASWWSGAEWLPRPMLTDSEPALAPEAPWWRRLGQERA